MLKYKILVGIAAFMALGVSRNIKIIEKSTYLEYKQDENSLVIA